jgi:site-specific recombinase XerD
MLTTYFKSSLSLARYRSGPAGPYLDDFSTWLEEQGYRQISVRRHIREAAHFADWTKTEGLSVQKCDRETLNKLRKHLSENSSLRKCTHLYQSARVFVSFLEATGIIAPPTTQQQAPELLREFCEWMRVQRGTMDSTLVNYRLPVTYLLQSLGSDPRDYTAKALREFLLRHIAHSKPGKSKNLATALRMFLRFLIARGDCGAGLDHAIPTVAQWRLSSLPKYLPANDVERLIDSCDSTSLLGARDRAILLLIARLGLRAGDVRALKFDDLEWLEGKVVVSGKARRQTRLPLSQEVGEAILHYLKSGRTHGSDYVFINTVAPFVPMKRGGIAKVVIRALRRTGISAPTQGTHLLRHSLATSMLRDGVSLPAVGALLRHTSIQTTQVYAKVDFALLREVAMPWPEVQSC